MDHTSPPDEGGHHRLLSPRSVISEQGGHTGEGQRWLCRLFPMLIGAVVLALLAVCTHQFQDDLRVSAVGAAQHVFSEGPSAAADAAQHALADGPHAAAEAADAAQHALAEAPHAAADAADAAQHALAVAPHAAAEAAKAAQRVFAEAEAADALDLSAPELAPEDSLEPAAAVAGGARPASASGGQRATSPSARAHEGSTGDEEPRANPDASAPLVTKRSNASDQPEQLASGEVTAPTVTRAGPPVGKKRHAHSNAHSGAAYRSNASVPPAPATKRPNASAEPEQRASGEVTALTVTRAAPPAGKKRRHAPSNASAGPANRSSAVANASLSREWGTRRTTPTTTITSAITITTTLSTTTLSTTTPQCDECAPAERDRPDVMIPVFERDLCKLKVTARSIVAHDPDGTLGKVFICWVSDKSRWDFADQLDEITHIFEQHGDVEVLEMQLGGMSGWIAQQSAKLKVASRVSSEYYIVMDAKNTLLRDLEPDTFFTPCNKGKVFGRYRISEMPAEHRSWFWASAGVLGQQVMDWGTWPASVTPMVLHRQTTLDMLSTLGEFSDFYSVCSGGLCDRFRQHATEFTLYLVYAARIASFDCIHAIEERPWGDELSTSIWRGDGNEASDQVRAIAEHSDRNGRPLFFGSQAGALDGFEGTARFDILKNLFTVYDNASLYDWATWDDMADCVVGRSR